MLGGHIINRSLDDQVQGDPSFVETSTEVRSDAGGSFLVLFLICWRLGKWPLGRLGGRIMWKAPFIAILWVIWKECNAHHFEGNPLWMTLQQIRWNFMLIPGPWVCPRRVSWYLHFSIIKKWKEVASSCCPRFWLVPYSTMDGILKLNSDKSAVRNLGLGSIEGVIHDSDFCIMPFWVQQDVTLPKKQKCCLWKLVFVKFIIHSKHHGGRQKLNALWWASGRCRSP